MIIQPYRERSSVSGIRLFLFLSLFLVRAFIMARVASAQADFARQYQAYKNAINATTTALNRSNYLAAADQFIKALDISPFEASPYSQRGLAFYWLGNDATAQRHTYRVKG